jgi:hypothetical protein
LLPENKRLFVWSNRSAITSVKTFAVPSGTAPRTNRHKRIKAGYGKLAKLRGAAELCRMFQVGGAAVMYSARSRLTVGRWNGLTKIDESFDLCAGSHDRDRGS